MNVKNEEQLQELLDELNDGPAKWVSMNPGLKPTSIGDNPFDHIIISSELADAQDKYFFFILLFSLF